MSKKSKYQHLIRVTKGLESSFRDAKTVSDMIRLIRCLNRENPLMWGCYRKVLGRGVREFVLTELITPGRDFISIIMRCDTRIMEKGPSKIVILVDCSVRARKSSARGNFRREPDVKVSDSAWEETLSCFRECVRNGHDLVSNLER